MSGCDGGDCEVQRTIENPERLLKAWKLAKFLYVAFASSLILWTILFVVLVFTIATEPLFMLTAGITIDVVLVVLAFSASVCRKILHENGASLVRSWCNVTHRPTEQFPRNSEELENYRVWLQKAINFHAKIVTNDFNSRKKSYAALMGARGGVASPEGPGQIEPSEIIGVRLKCRRELDGRFAERDDRLAKLKSDHDEKKQRAGKTYSWYNSWWNLASDLGKFYKANVLPVDQNGAPFSDPNVFRKSLPDQKDDSEVVASCTL